MYTLQEAIVARLGGQLQKRITALEAPIISLFCKDTAPFDALLADIAPQIHHFDALTSDGLVQSDLLICDLLHDDSTEAQQWLALQRNVWAREIALVIDSEQCSWPANTLLGLGFFRLVDSEGQQLWYYAIDNYNRKRQWNNNQYWANPQNFDKFRW